MTQEVLIPKMKRIDKRQRKIRIPLLNLVVIIFCTMLLDGATFVNINIKHYYLPLEFFSDKTLTPDDYIKSFCIIPQIPIVMFICSFLGRRMALTSIILYILGGLFFAPVFALGGGIHYVTEYSFGYILGFVPAVMIAGGALRKVYSFKNMFLAAFSGVLTIHLCGILYMILIALIKRDGSSFIEGWISAQSGLKIVYDFVGSFVLILMGKYFHSVTKFIME